MDESEFFAAMHLMRDAFVLLKGQVERAGWDATEQNGAFFF